MLHKHIDASPLALGLRRGGHALPARQPARPSAGWEKTSRYGKAITLLAHKRGRAVYFMLKREKLFDQERLLTTAWAGRGLNGPVQGEPEWILEPPTPGA